VRGSPLGKAGSESFPILLLRQEGDDAQVISACQLRQHHFQAPTRPDLPSQGSTQIREVLVWQILLREARGESGEHESASSLQGRPRNRDLRLES
jgi:hypothetical protein